MGKASKKPANAATRSDTERHGATNCVTPEDRGSELAKLLGPYSGRELPTPSEADCFRFDQETDRIRDDDSCWEWFGATKSGPARYGFFRYQGGQYLAHRVSYLMKVGSVFTSDVVCHRCDNPSCVRPSHLFLGTQADNIDDMYDKGRGRGTGRRARPSEDALDQPGLVSLDAYRDDDDPPELDDDFRELTDIFPTD